MPLDFTNIQLSVWAALIPATWFVYINFSILKLENVEEYFYFKRNRGITKLRNTAILSYLTLGCYLVVVAFNIEAFLKANKKSIVW